ncbi:response regulator [Gracilibacillus xinjiangensis]|uniref:Response regulator n=1 Tax=Gracilibacillus xinjiangensis TaxID=1193282 RepID=A0ABV8WWK1_9BACI
MIDMFKAILIDDERLALNRLKKILENDEFLVEIIGTFQQSMDAIEYVKETPPDIVFLDIHMPGVNGLEIANKIQEHNANIQIVFVTGYDRYAIEAFELFALDYILKPIQKPRLKKTIDRMRKMKVTNQGAVLTNEQITLSCFHEISFVFNNEEIPIKWRTKKALELFAYLLQQRDKFVPKDLLIDMFWPDFSIEKASQQLYTTIYHIRNALKKANIRGVEIKSSSRMDSGYNLIIGENVHYILDTWTEDIQTLQEVNYYNHNHFLSLFNQYKGDVLASYNFSWAASEVEKYRQFWLQLAEKISLYYEKKGEYKQAVYLYQNVQQLCPLIETSYFKLMKLYNEMKMYKEVEHQFDRLTKMLETEFDLPPSMEIYEWYQAYQKHFYKYS